MIGRESVKRWTDAETQKWLMIGKNEILPRLEERVSALRPLFESATKKAREGAESELNAIERKTLQDIRAERKKQADIDERTTSAKRYKADERMAAIRDNFSRGGQYEMTGDPFNFSPRLDHYFTDKLGNRFTLGIEWGGGGFEEEMTSAKINKLWRNLGRMDAEKDEEELNYLQREAIETLAKINPAENRPRVVSFSVKRPNGDEFIPAGYIEDWVLQGISIAQRGTSKYRHLGFFQTQGEKPTNDEEDEFYDFMCAVIRKSLKGKP